MKRMGLLAALAAAGTQALQYPYYNVGQTANGPMPTPTPAETRRWRDRRGYPQTGTGKRQGARVARQVARALGDPFAASNKCIERIKAP